MTVAPELPPASAPLRRPVEPLVAPTPRSARRHPFGAAAHATSRTGSPARVDRPMPRRSPEAAAGGLPAGGLAELVDRPDAGRSRLLDPPGHPPGHPPGQETGQETGRERRPAAPVRLRPVDSRPVGARVVRPAWPRSRLTLRGRMLAGLVAVLAMLTTSLAVAERIQALHEPASVVPATAPAEIVVAPGETLWSIALRVAPARDPRSVVDQIRRINQLPGGDVQAGQTLRLRAP